MQECVAGQFTIKSVIVISLLFLLDTSHHWPLRLKTDRISLIIHLFPSWFCFLDLQKSQGKHASTLETLWMEHDLEWITNLALQSRTNATLATQPRVRLLSPASSALMENLYGTRLSLHVKVRMQWLQLANDFANVFYQTSLIYTIKKKKHWPAQNTVLFQYCGVI